MTHEGRMARGEEKHSKGITDIETEYYLDNKDKEGDMSKDAIKEKKRIEKELKEDVKSKSG